MEHIKYSGPWPEVGALGAQVRRKVRIGKWLHRLGTAVFLTVLGVLLAVCTVAIFTVLPWPEGLFFQLMTVLARGVLSLVALVVSVTVAALAAAPLWGRHRTSEKQVRQAVQQAACRQLREFYGFQEPCLVTKCYSSSDRRFDRHDVCLFLHRGKLRITANLHYGFFHPDRDLGCYVLEPEELLLNKTSHKDRSAVELRCGEAWFCLGAKAAPFLQTQLSLDPL